MEKVSDFNTRLNELFEKTGHTGLDIALKTGISAGAISRYRAGLRSPSARTVDRLAEAFGVHVAWLMGYSEDAKKRSIPVPVISNPNPKKRLFGSDNFTDTLITVPTDWHVDYVLVLSEDTGEFSAGDLAYCEATDKYKDEDMVVCNLNKERYIVTRVRTVGKTIVLDSPHGDLPYPILLDTNVKKASATFCGVVHRVLVTL